MKNKKQKWEVLFEDYSNGGLDKKIKELDDKHSIEIKNKKDTKEKGEATKSYVKQKKQLEKIKGNLPKIQNLIEFKDTISSMKTEIDDEIKNREAISKLSKVKIEIDKEHEALMSKVDKIQKKLKSKDISDEDKKKLQEELQKTNKKCEENNENYIKTTDGLKKAEQKSGKSGKFEKFDKEELKNFRKMDSFLQGHPDMKKVPGVDMTTGSLGQGLSAGVGMAIASKMNQAGCRVYCVLGDGEIEEGQIWEAAMAAYKNKLDNLCVILDNNSLQIDGKIQDVAGLDNIEGKFKNFGFNVIQVDGHNISNLIDGFNSAKQTKQVPTILIAKTIKGKGVSFMENQAKWHGKAPNEEEYEKAINELDTHKFGE